jgi:putative addiction module component (TIGR02574 family)
MAASRDDILRQALALPEHDRADLIRALIESLDTEADEGVEEAWRVEIERRAQELDSGTVESIPWEVVRARLARAPRG